MARQSHINNPEIQASEAILSKTEIIPLVIGLGLASKTAGLLGMGDGVVIVPAVFWLFIVIRFNSEISIRVAVATSIVTTATMPRPVWKQV